MRKEKLDERVLKKLKLPFKNEPDIDSWKEFLGRLKNPTNDVKICLIGKYVELPDAYKSISEAFIHSGAENECNVDVDYISSEHLNPDNMEQKLGKYHGILVAPGFGERGMPGKIEAVRFARENKVPFFGICLGMQCAVIEFAQNVLEISDASSTELNAETSNPVIDLMEEQKKITAKGGTMRLGAYPCNLKKGSKAHNIYGKSKIMERHRHRYEFNNKYLEQFINAGMIASGINPDSELVEIVELNDHPWFVGTQFHPELRSTVRDPHPLFFRFIKASLEYKKNREEVSV
jgi:CTP synthase